MTPLKDAFNLHLIKLCLETKTTYQGLIECNANLSDFSYREMSQKKNKQTIY